MPGTLYVVATPIGNLEDLSRRAERTLREAALIAAEDTRVTRKLLARYEIHTPMTSYHAHTDRAKVKRIVERLMSGDNVALVSDAGTPGISDPGAQLVRAAVDVGVAVVPIPGPSAIITALCASGLDTARFVFQGFLPRNAGDRRRELAPLRALRHTLVFYESPERLAGTLTVLREVLGDRSVAVARELSKRFEEFVRGSLAEVEAHFRETSARGECVILVAGAAEEESTSLEDADARLRALLDGGASVRDAARIAAEEVGLPKRELYARARTLQAQTPT